METQTPKLGDLETVKHIRGWLARSNAKPLRRIARICLALIFWAHALLLFHLLPTFAIPSIHWAGLSNRDLLLLSTILFYTLLGANGWFSLLYDLVWVYVFPIQVGFKAAWRIGKLSVRLLRKHLIGPVSEPILATSAEAEAKPSTESPIQSTTITAGKRTDWWSLLYKFATLWGALVVVSNSKPVVVAGIIVTTVSALRACIMFGHSVSYSVKWIEDLQNRTAAQLGAILNKILTKDRELSNEELAKAVQTLTVFEKLLRFASNKDTMMKCSVTLSLLLSLPYYLYISTLCSFTYFGISKIAGYSWHWSDALIDSLFIPLAWTELPKILLIRLFGGLQAAVLVFLSFKAVFGQIQRKTEGLSHALAKLQENLEKPEVRTTILMVKQALPNKTETSNKELSKA